MRFFRRALVSSFAFVASVALVAGGVHIAELPPAYLSVRAPAAAQMKVLLPLAFIAELKVKPPITWPSGRRQRIEFERTWRRWLEHLAFEAWLAGLGPTTTGGFISWDCVATQESSADWTAHSSTYSSAFGMLNAAVRERADSPESAARILAGTASRLEQIHAASREVARFGVGAWGVRTVARCT